MVRLRDLGNWAGGNTPSKANAAYWTEGTVPWVSPKDMKVDEIASSQDLITELALTDRRISMVPEGSVLFVTRSGILSHTFPVAITKLPVTINQDLKALTPKAGVSPKYVAHAIRGASQRILRECSKHGTTVASIETSRLLDFEIPLVGFNEQIEIVAELEKQFSRLDEAVANLKRVKANLKRYKAAVLKDAVEGRLVPTEAELARRDGRGFETGKQLLQRILETRRSQWSGRGQYKEPEAPIVTELSVLPEGWVYATAEQMCDPIASGSTPAPAAMFSGDGEVPFLKVYNLTFDGSLDFTVKPTFVKRETHQGMLARSRSVPGDVLMNIVGPPLGKISIVSDLHPEWNINQAIVTFRTSAGLLNQLLAYWLMSTSVLSRLERTAKATAGQSNLQVSTCRRLPLPIPPIAEQGRIVAEVDRRLSLVRGVETEVDANLKRAQSLRQSTLQKAFTPS